MAADGALNREGQIWKLSYTYESQLYEMLWLVVSGPVSESNGQITHKVLVLETTGSYWSGLIKQGCEHRLHENTPGGWDGHVNMTRVA